MNEKPMLETFKNNLIKYREDNKITNKDIIEKAGISEKSFYNIMNLKGGKPDTLERIVKGLDNRPLAEWLLPYSPINASADIEEAVKESLSSFASFFNFKPIKDNADKIAKDVIDKLQKKKGK